MVFCILICIAFHKSQKELNYDHECGRDLGFWKKCDKLFCEMENKVMISEKKDMNSLKCHKTEVIEEMVC